MRRDWRGPSSSSTISRVRLGFMTWFEARSARTGVSKWIAAGILKQFSVTPAPAGDRRRENPDDRFHQHNLFSSYKSCSIAQEQRLGFDWLQRQHLSVRADRLRSRRSEMALDNDQIRMTKCRKKTEIRSANGTPGGSILHRFGLRASFVIWHLSFGFQSSVIPSFPAHGC